jgi:hypothetical protein
MDNARQQGGNFRKAKGRRKSMSILLGKYDFCGPFVAQAEILDKPGLIAVLVQTTVNSEEEFELLELLETASCRHSAARAFADCTVDGALSLAVYYAETDEHAVRCRLKSEIIAEFESEGESQEQDWQENKDEGKVCVGVS